MNEDVKIEIGDVLFSKQGMLYMEGLVNNDFVKVRIDLGCVEFERIIPKEPCDFRWQDDDGFVNATIDDHHNLHWHIIQDGLVLCRTVWLKPIIEDLLYQKYISTR